MGVHGLEYYVTNVPMKGCAEVVEIKKLADAYRRETGRDPVALVDGSNCLRNIYFPKGEEWILGGQMKEFVEAMKDFVAAFQRIGVTLIFYFDGATPDQKRDNWLSRRNNSIRKVVQLFRKLDDISYKPKYQLPPLFGGTGRFVAKFECHCDVSMSLSECDAEMADYAWQHDCFAILSRDTDFILLQGARYYISLRGLNMTTMTATKFSRESLLNALELQQHELLLVASLLGNDMIPFEELEEFHMKLCGTRNIRRLLPAVAKYVRRKNIPESCKERDLHQIAMDVFCRENKAWDLAASIKSYRPYTSDRRIDELIKSQEDRNWRKILNLAWEKHLSCEVTTHLFPVMIGDAYEMSIALEDYGKDVKPTAKIYRPLRQRIYGILLHEKPGASTVREWCVESMECREPSEVTITKIKKIEILHPGLLQLWHKNSKPAVKWRLFAKSLTQRKRLKPKELECLGFPHVVPVAVLFYLQQECEGLLEGIEMDAILAHVATVNTRSTAELSDIQYRKPTARMLYVSTVFHRGVTTVLFLLAACGFTLDKAMPWFYFDGKLLHEKYIQATIHGERGKQLCGNQKDVHRIFKQMKDLVGPV